MKNGPLVNRKSKYRTLKTLYETNITIDTIAENLMVCGIDDQAQAIKQELTEKNYDVIGVSEGSEVIGYVERDGLQNGTIRDFVKPFNTRDIITDSTPLIQFLAIFKNRKRMFVLEKNEVTQLITAADLQKPPVRILIFGYITLLEMNLGELIQVKFADNRWKSLLNESRLAKAEALFMERKAKNQDINLIECLQISDKLQIIMNSPELKEHFQIPSKTEWKRMTKNIRDLRGRIAHSNELGMDMTWEEIITSLQKCEILLKGIEGLLTE